LTAVMAIRREHADRIYRGDKQFEFRRQRPRFTPGLKIFIYEPTPVRAVTGHFHVADLIDIDTNLSVLEEDECARAIVESYLRGGRRPTAIRVAGAKRLYQPLSLESLGVKAAPQSYVFIGSR
jgi:predicted transcriptional regulator